MVKSATEPSFEEALSELEKIVRGLEGGSADLKTSIDSYERGMALKKLCEQKLKEAEGRIEKITVSESGKVSVSPVSLGE